VYYTNFPVEVMKACLEGIRAFREKHGANASRLHFPIEFEQEIMSAGPDILGREVAHEIMTKPDGNRWITRARIDGIELTINWGADQFRVT